MGKLAYAKAPRQPDRGFVLFITLVTLVILTISGIAMMRVLGAGVTAAGNIAFRQSAVRVADLAIEGARAWLLAQTAVYLQTDHPADGYYATSQPGFSPKTYDWTNAGVTHQYVVGSNDTFSGYKLYYVIHRMAVNSGVPCSDPNARCLFPANASSAGTTEGTSQAGGGGYTTFISGETGLVYYRVTVKVAGPRYNNRFVQVFMY